MKTLLTAIVLATASVSANANGFYEQVIDQTNRAALVSQEVAGQNGFEATAPLYEVVNANRNRAAQGEDASNSKTSITWTPLYEKVKGMI